MSKAFVLKFDLLLLTCFSFFFFRLQILSFSCLRQESCTRHGDWHRPIWALAKSFGFRLALSETATTSKWFLRFLSLWASLGSRNFLASSCLGSVAETKSGNILSSMTLSTYCRECSFSSFSFASRQSKGNGLFGPKSSTQQNTRSQFVRPSTPRIPVWHNKSSWNIYLSPQCNGVSKSHLNKRLDSKTRTNPIYQECRKPRPYDYLFT